MKKQYLIIGGVLLLVYFLMKRKNTTTTTAPEITETGSDGLTPELDHSLRVMFGTVLKDNYSPEFAKQMEKMYRFETGHFKSGQFLEGYSPGMVGTGVYPWGWNSLNKYIDDYLRTTPEEAAEIKARLKLGRVFSVRGRNYQYVCFPNPEFAINFVAWFIWNIRGGRVGKWGTLSESGASLYEETIQGVRTKYT